MGTNPLQSVLAEAIDCAGHAAVMQQHVAPVGLIQPTTPSKHHTLSQARCQYNASPQGLLTEAVTLAA